MGNATCEEELKDKLVDEPHVGDAFVIRPSLGGHARKVKVSEVTKGGFIRFAGSDSRLWSKKGAMWSIRGQRGYDVALAEPYDPARHDRDLLRARAAMLKAVIRDASLDAFDDKVVALAEALAIALRANETSSPS